MAQAPDRPIDLNTLGLPALYRELSRTGLVRRLLELARDEDLGQEGDVTSACFLGEKTMGRGALVARSEGIVAGLEAMPEVLSVLAPACRFAAKAGDGQAVGARREIGEISGPLREILAVERTALNIIGRLSGVATRTAEFVKALGTAGRARLYDTRKTTPGMRVLEKYAVRCGGGLCHRLGLFDAVLIKDNHLTGLPAAALGLHTAGAAARARGAYPGKLRFVEVEVDSLEQLTAVLEVQAKSGERERIDIALLDNMTPEGMRACAAERDRLCPRVELEASGGITLEIIGEVGQTGVDRVSVGGITHHAVWMDVALDVAPAG